MLGRKNRPQAAVNSLVGAETRVEGDIEFSGGFHVDGYVRGNVKAPADERSTLSISERGCVEGSVSVPHVLLNGTVNGDVRATERIELGPKARVIGNVQYKLIEMAIGAEVNGKLLHESERVMDVDVPSLEPVASLD
ncbi:MAG TPA: polymer-forming cytoskeletal protein [Gammaproteobacteria bacterium]|nr:polymer-forming cytoskeletal protein [Gammaproteobacteria bacterium]